MQHSVVYWITIFIFLVGAKTSNSNPTDYGTTHADINESIKRLDNSVKDLENKLNRHEAREAQVADFSTKTLNALSADHTLTQKNMKAVAKQLASLEEKLFSMESLIQVTNEGQRNKLDKINEGLNRLLMAKPDFSLDLLPLPPHPQLPAGGDFENFEKELKKILRRVNVIDESFKRNVKSLNNEVKIVGESLKQHMEQLNTRQDRIWNDWNTCKNDQIHSLNEITSSLTQTGTVFVDQINEAKKVFAKGEKSQNECQILTNEVVERLNALDIAYQDQEKELSSLNQDTHAALKEQKEDLKTLLKEATNEKLLLENFFGEVIGNLKELNGQSQDLLGKLESDLKNIIKISSEEVKKEIENVARVMKETNSNVLNSLDDAASMTENLQGSITGNFEDLTKDIRSLKKVEQVMLSTADAVLDTKRSIEFGIQQVIIELSDTVRNNGKNINSTLSDHINNISFAILKNQTSALTNMTSKMENEISQVWRQIGIMYQQVAQSVNILDEIQITTSQHMNASLDKADTMDGTVGAITTKVADVEDNLNYLLGRLSLVVSEFSQMKSGVGDELNKLREMAKEFSGKGLPEYTINKK